MFEKQVFWEFSSRIPFVIVLDDEAVFYSRSFSQFRNQFITVRLVFRPKEQKSILRSEQVDHSLFGFSSWYVMDFLWDLIFPDFFLLQACANFIQMIHKWLVNVCTTESRYFTQTRISMMSQSKCIFIDEIFPRLLVRPLTIKTKLPSWLIQKNVFYELLRLGVFLIKKTSNWLHARVVWKITIFRNFNVFTFSVAVRLSFVTGVQWFISPLVKAFSLDCRFFFHRSPWRFF